MSQGTGEELSKDRPACKVELGSFFFPRSSGTSQEGPGRNRGMQCPHSFQEPRCTATLYTSDSQIHTAREPQYSQLEVLFPAALRPQAHWWTCSHHYASLSDGSGCCTACGHYLASAQTRTIDTMRAESSTVAFAGIKTLH